MRVAEQLRRPASVIFSAVVSRVGRSSRLRSRGVAQRMSPPQYRSTARLGVAPETIVQHSASPTVGQRELSVTILTRSAALDRLGRPVSRPPRLRDDQ